MTLLLLAKLTKTERAATMAGWLILSVEGAKGKSPFAQATLEAEPLAPSDKRLIARSTEGRLVHRSRYGCQGPQWFKLLTNPCLPVYRLGRPGPNRNRRRPALCSPAQPR